MAQVINKIKSRLWLFPTINPGLTLSGIRIFPKIAFTLFITIITNRKPITANRHLFGKTQINDLWINCVCKYDNLNRERHVIVASVSCIYNLGFPKNTKITCWGCGWSRKFNKEILGKFAFAIRTFGLRFAKAPTGWGRHLIFSRPMRISLQKWKIIKLYKLPKPTH